MSFQLSDGRLPSYDKITAVSEACECSEEHAIRLLERTKHDVKRAIRLNKIYNAGRPPAPQSNTTSGRATPSPSEDDRSSQREQASSIDDADKDVHMPDAQSSARDHTFNNSHYDFQRWSGPPTFSLTARESPKAAQSQDFLNFELPRLGAPSLNLKANITAQQEAFDVRAVVASMQRGAKYHDVRAYLGRNDNAEVRRHINDEVQGFPAIFYVVETNDVDMLRLWHTYDGNVSAVHAPTQLPLLAYAIMHGETLQADTSLMTSSLLALGASPDVIPKAFYIPFMQDLPEKGPTEDKLVDLTAEQRLWCTEEARARLAQACSLSQRYFLERATTARKPSRRQQQVAERMDAGPLLGITNFLIGQTNAAKALLDTLLAHLTVAADKPLVLVFAGPSGHGKTELARCLGQLMSLKLEVVDCSIVNQEMELFGPRQPYVGSEKGTPLNNFLTEHNGKQCIVFLDEFDKTGSAIHKTLLLPFENGEYQDRRNLDKIDCRKTIWILATNAHDAIIQQFATSHKAVLFAKDEEVEIKKLLKQLSHKVREDFKAKHGPPITGRITDFIPFLTFSPGEQAVIVHKALLELARKVREPINLTSRGEEKLLGNVRLRIRRDGAVCKALAEAEYHEDLGARSLISGAAKVKRLLVEEYLKMDEEISEDNRPSNFLISAEDGEIVVHAISEGVSE